MAKFKPARGKAKSRSSLKAAIPCLFIILLGTLLMWLLFSAVLKTGTP